jgi:hypothetical protein
MALLRVAAQAASRRLPRFISSDLHCTSDYVLSGTMIAGGMVLWRSNRRASIASLICGGSLLGLSLMTHYPGRKRKPINFVRHASAESGMAVLMATLPGILRLEKGTHRIFAFHAAALSTLNNLTSFHPPEFVSDKH